MGRQTEEIEISGSIYRLTMLPTKRAQRLLAKLTRVLVPSLAKAVGSAAAAQALKEDGLKGLLDMNIGAGVADGVLHLFDKLTEDEQAHILGELLLDAMVKPEGAERMVKLSDVSEDHFAGRISVQYRVAFESLKLNYSDFWQPLIAAVSAYFQKAEEPKKQTATA